MKVILFCALFIIIIFFCHQRKRRLPTYIVSLTMIPSRTNNIHDLVDSMRKQTVPPKYIVVNIPEKYERFDQSATFDDIPDGVFINRIGQDYGPATKLLGIHKFDRNDFDVILVVDDDTYKHPEWAERLITQFRAGIVTCVVQPGPNNRAWNTRRDHIYGYTGFGIDRRLFRDISANMVHEWNRLKSGCFMVDDDFFTYYFNSRGHKIHNCFYTNMGRMNSRWLSSPNGLVGLQGEDKRKNKVASCKQTYCDTCDGEYCDSVCLT